MLLHYRESFMPYVRRNSEGAIEAVSETSSADASEFVEGSNYELNQFLAAMSDNNNDLGESDLSLVRVIEDVVELLISKNVILFTELPPAAQDKMMQRKQLRSRHSNDLQLLDDDEDGIL
jgi:hypothetical protein